MSNATVKLLKKDLDAALRIVAIGVEGGDDDKLTTHIVFRSVDGVLEMLSSGTRVFASVTPATLSLSAGDWMFTLAAWRLQALLSSVTDPDAEISIDYVGGLSTLTMNGRKGRIASLDASTFPFWDQTLAAATLSSTVEARHLLASLDYAKRFVSDQDTKSPNLCAVECRDGLLHATDTIGFALVEAPAFTGVGIRVCGKDISSANAFLGAFSGDKIEILEHAKCQIFRHGNALVGITRWPYEFPPLKLSRDDKDKCAFTLRASTLREAITHVGIFAKKTDRTLYFSIDADNLVVGAKTAAGAADKDTVSVPTSSMENMDEFTNAYAEFRLDRDHIDKVLSSCLPDEDLRIGVGWTKKNGFVRIRRKADDIDCFTVVAWSK